MFDQLLGLFHSAVGALSHGDKLAAAGVTMWLLTITGVLLRRVPMLVYRKIRSKLIVTMTMNKTSSLPNSPEVKNFNSFIEWFDTLPSSRFDRNRRPVFTPAGHVTFVPGLGFHWFIFNGRYFWFRYSELDSQGIEYQKERIVLWTFGISLKPLEKLTNAFSVKLDNNYLRVMTPGTAREGWVVAGSIPTKNHPALIVNDNVQREVFDRVAEWKGSEQWYRDRGLAYKMTIMLMGPPGTGKTSIGREIAIMHKMRFHDMNLSMMDNASFIRAITQMKPGVLLIDDFEDNPAFAKRVLEVPEGEDSTNPIRASRSGVSLSTLFSVLDGAIPLDRVIIVMATNHPEKLDPAIYRPGRVDYNVVVHAMEASQILQYIHRMYGMDYTGDLYPTTIAALSSIFNRNKHSYENFVKEYLDYHTGKLRLGVLEYSGSPEKQLTN